MTHYLCLAALSFVCVQPFTYSFHVLPTNKWLTPLTAATYNPYATVLLQKGPLQVVALISNTLGATAVFPMDVDVTLTPEAQLDLVGFVNNITNGVLTEATTLHDDIKAMGIINALGALIAWDPSKQTVPLALGLLDRLQDYTPPMPNALVSMIASTALSSYSTLPAPQSYISLMQNITSKSINSPAVGGIQAAVLGDVVSNLLRTCVDMNPVSLLVGQLLNAMQRHATVGQNPATLNTTNVVASSSITGLANGLAIYDGHAYISLSPAAVASYAAVLNTLTPTNIDTAGSSGAPVIYTQSIQWNTKWTRCRGSGLASDITDITVWPLDFGQLGEPFTFLLPFTGPPSDMLPNITLGPCDPARPLDDYFTCAFYNHSTGNFSTDGCYSNGLYYAQPRLPGDQAIGLNCSCNHFTEFAVLLDIAAGQSNSCAVVHSEILGAWWWLLFVIAYLLTGLFGLFQFARVFVPHKCTYWLMTIEHWLVFFVCMLRALCCLVFYTLYKGLSTQQMSLILGLPYLLLSWIFTFVIFAWASIYHASAKGQRSSNPFEPYKKHFIALNSVVTLLLFAIFIFIGRSKDLDEMDRLSKVGTTVMICTAYAFVGGFAVYGSLLVRSLTKDFTSPYAKKLALVAVGLSSCFFLSATSLLISLAEPNYHAKKSPMFEVLYYAFDWLGLVIVLLLFAKSVRDSLADQTKSTGTAGSGKKQFTAKSRPSLFNTVNPNSVNIIQEAQAAEESSSDDSSDDDSDSDSDSDSDEEFMSPEHQAKLAALAAAGTQDPAESDANLKRKWDLAKKFANKNSAARAAAAKAIAGAQSGDTQLYDGYGAELAVGDLADCCLSVPAGAQSDSAASAESSVPGASSGSDVAISVADALRAHQWCLIEVLDSTDVAVHVREVNAEIPVEKRRHQWLLKSGLELQPARTQTVGDAVDPERSPAPVMTLAMAGEMNSLAPVNLAVGGGNGSTRPVQQRRRVHEWHTQGALTEADEQVTEIRFTRAARLGSVVKKAQGVLRKAQLPLKLVSANQLPTSSDGSSSSHSPSITGATDPAAAAADVTSASYLLKSAVKRAILNKRNVYAEPPQSLRSDDDGQQDAAAAGSTDVQPSPPISPKATPAFSSLAPSTPLVIATPAVDLGAVTLHPAPASPGTPASAKAPSPLSPTAGGAKRPSRLRAFTFSSAASDPAADPSPSPVPKVGLWSVSENASAASSSSGAASAHSGPAPPSLTPSPPSTAEAEPRPLAGRVHSTGAVGSPLFGRRAHPSASISPASPSAASSSTPNRRALSLRNVSLFSLGERALDSLDSEVAASGSTPSGVSPLSPPPRDRPIRLHMGTAARTVMTHGRQSSTDADDEFTASSPVMSPSNAAAAASSSASGSSPGVGVAPVKRLTRMELLAQQAIDHAKAKANKPKIALAFGSSQIKPAAVALNRSLSAAGAAQVKQ